MTTKTIFITGASSGIGLATALRLNDMGYRVIVGNLPSEPTTRLDQADIKIIPLDITKQDMISNARDVLEREVGDAGLYGLFNNAGIAGSGPMEFVPMAAIRRTLDVNLFGHIAVTQALLPLMRKQGHGRIVNTTSILGRIVVPFSGPYCMSKFGMEAFTDALRMELKSSNISVSAIEPGAISTDIWEKATQDMDEIREELPPNGQELYGEGLEGLIDTTHKVHENSISPDIVAKKVAHAFTSKRPRTRYVVGTDAKFVAIAKRWLPDRWFDRMIMSRYPSMQE